MKLTSVHLTNMILAVAVIAAGVLGVGLFLGRSERATSAAETALLRPDPGWEDVRFPDFSLVDQNGKAVNQTIFDGRVTIVDFIFTSCPLQCPAMTGSLWAVGEELKNMPVRFLSMSIDPDRDTPERLKKYAADYGIDPGRWPFLTGGKDVVRNIVRNALMFEVSDNPDSQVTLADGSTMPNIIHPPHFVLVGPNRQVLGIFYYQDSAQMDRLKDRARRLAQTIR